MNLTTKTHPHHLTSSRPARAASGLVLGGSFVEAIELESCAMVRSFAIDEALRR